MPMLIPRDRNWFVRDSSLIRFLFRRSKVRISFQIAFLVVFLECGRIMAQVEPRQAAPFVPDQTPTSLADLLREYRELGLPLPAKGAKLISAGYRPFLNPADGNVATQFAFTSKPGKRNQPAQFLIGLTTRELDEPYLELKDPIDLRIVEDQAYSESADPNRLPAWISATNGELILAIQCHAEGRDKLANYFFERCRSCASIPLSKKLVLIAWENLADQLGTAQADQAAVGKRLKALVAKHPDLANDEARRLISDLEKPPQPLVQEADPVEKLLDRLTGYCSENVGIDLYYYRDLIVLENGMNGNNVDRAAESLPSKIALLGFEAVPCLLKHLGDERLTRSRRRILPADQFQDGVARVGDFAQALLNLWVDHHNWPQNHGPRDAAFYHAWWQEVCQQGEQKHLLQNLFANQPFANQPLEGNPPYIPYLYLIYLKYPGQLPSIYKDILVNQPKRSSDLVAPLIASGPFPLEDKVRWLLLGVKHDCLGHQKAALMALERVDKKRFEAAWLESMQVHLKKDVDWGESPFCSGIAVLACLTENPKVWQLLEKVAKLAPVERRGSFLCEFPSPSKIKKIQIHFLFKFIDDESVWENRFETPDDPQFVSVKRIEIRNVAAMKLATFWGMSCESEAFTPADWKSFRDKIRARVEKELKEK